jgi:hypothetical protein
MLRRWKPHGAHCTRACARFPRIGLHDVVQRWAASVLCAAVARTDSWHSVIEYIWTRGCVAGSARCSQLGFVCLWLLLLVLRMRLADVFRRTALEASFEIQNGRRVPPLSAHHAPSCSLSEHAHTISLSRLHSYSLTQPHLTRRHVAKDSRALAQNGCCLSHQLVLRCSVRTCLSDPLVGLSQPPSMPQTTAVWHSTSCFCLESHTNLVEQLPVVPHLRSARWT